MRRRWSADELGERWTLGPEDLALLADLPDAGKLGLAAQLAHWRRHGRFPDDEADLAPAVNDLIAAAAARAGLPPVHPHMLRHSCGFYLANRGYDLRLIQDYLGLRDPKHTVRYTRVAGSRFEGLWR